MPIPLLVAFVAIAVPFASIITALILNAKFQRQHSKEMFGKKSANNLTRLTIIAFSIALVITTYFLINFGVTMN